MKHFDPNQVPILISDTSAYGLGVVLLQLDNKIKEHPMVFTTRTLLNSGKKMYIQIDKDAFEIIFEINKFDKFL